MVDGLPCRAITCSLEFVNSAIYFKIFTLFYQSKFVFVSLIVFFDVIIVIFYVILYYLNYLNSSNYDFLLS